MTEADPEGRTNSQGTGSREAQLLPAGRGSILPTPASHPCSPQTERMPPCV